MVEAQTYQMHPDMFEAKFLSRCWEDLDKIKATQDAWIDFMLTSGLDDIRPLYYMSTWWNDTDITVNTKAGEIDVEATIKQIARVIKWALSKHYEVKKEYTDLYFTVEVTSKNGATLEFKANRQIACRKVFIKTEVKTNDVYEWECEHIAFTGVDTD